MILLLAVAAGLLVGLGWAGRQQVKYEAPSLRHLWLVFAAFVPQYIVVRSAAMPDTAASIGLIVSQILFLVFALLNYEHQGMRILMAGAALNLLVMITNGGFMPISPHTASRLISQELLLDISSGSRFGAKDILLLPEHTRFEWLADRFLPPAGSPYQVAFSLGDVFIAAGVFWLLARPKKI